MMRLCNPNRACRFHAGSLGGLVADKSQGPLRF
jgi:hypothetical protein